MLKSILNRKSALACSADCAADDHAPARTVFIRDGSNANETNQIKIYRLL